MIIGCDNMVLYKEEKLGSNNGNLSAIRPKEPILKTGLETNPQLQTILKQKSIIKIYVDENKYYVEHSAAFVFGLIKTRAIMLDKPKLIEISSEAHNKLKSNDSIKIEYIRVEKKQKLKIYTDGSQYCIDNSAAYALGFISVEEFHNSESEYYYIPEDILNKLKEKFNVGFYPLNLEQYSSCKKP